MPETPPAPPDPDCEPDEGPEDSPPAGRRAQRKRVRPTESILFVAIGLVVGIVATLVVTQQRSSDRPARIVTVVQGPVATVTTGPTAGPITGPTTGPTDGPSGSRTANGTAPAPSSARPGAAPAKTIPPAAKPDPALIGLVHIRPAAVKIPAADISSSLVDLGLNGDGSLQVPTDYSQAGWYSNGAYPGDADGPPALIVGHVDNYKGPAVFFRLSKLKTGAKIYVRRIDGSTATFVVYRIGNYLKSKFPARSVYEPTRRPELRLITCTGDFDESAGSYLSNLVVFARLVPPGSDSEGK